MIKKVLFFILVLAVFLIGCTGNDAGQENVPGVPQNNNSDSDEGNKDNDSVGKDKPDADNSNFDGRIYFMRDLFIFSAKADGTDIKQLTTTGEENKPDSHPAVSRDGTQLVYSFNKNIIYKISTDGGEATEIDKQLWADNPVFSPDMKQVAYDMDYLDNYVIATSSTETMSFITQYGRAYNPRSWPDWSPDGSKIVATELSDGGSNFHLVFIHPDTKEYETVPYDTNYHYFSASFSPDGQKLAVIQSAVDNNLVYSLWIMNIDGSNPLEIAEGVSHARPTWSPDGKNIAFTRDNSIYVISISGDDEKLLIENGQSPAWGK